MKESPPREAQRLNPDSTTSPPRPAAAMLPFESLPVVMRQHGVSEGHTYPLVGHRLANDEVRSWRCSPRVAWAWPLVEWCRTGTSIVAIVIDIDSHLGRELLAQALMSASSIAPQPNFVAYRGRTGHAQAAWTLKRAVLRGAKTRAKPLRALARVSEWFLQGLDGDPGFRGVLASNPVHHHYVTRWHRRDPYSLTQLLEYVPRGWHIPKPPQTDAGRNNAIFTGLVRFAGSAAHSDEAVRRYGQHLYEQIDVHKPHAFTQAELAGTIASVLRYRATWRDGRPWHDPKWIERQATRGRRNTAEQQVLKGIRSGEVRRERTENRDQRILHSKLPAVVVAEAEGVTERTVRRIRARGKKRTRTTNTDDQP